MNFVYIDPVIDQFIFNIIIIDNEAKDCLIRNIS